MIINIFNKNIKISVTDEELDQVLRNELKGYNHVDGNIDAYINFVNKIEDDGLYSNAPKIHKTLKNGFISVFGSNVVKYYIEDQSVKVDLQINNRNYFINKVRSIDYRSNIERIGTILHELVFVLITFFDKNLAPIHASSMKSKKGTICMFGGTGGVGKTSLELLLCRELDFSFISDDIAIVDRGCYIYPNLSYPKIYAYNTEGDRTLEKLILYKRTLLDKLQWKISKKLKGEDKVRRSLSPFDLFGAVEVSKNKIDKYFILHKTNSVNKITFKEIDYGSASSMTLDIIINEYHSVIQHIIWHEYNAKLMAFDPILSHEILYKNWLDTYNFVLKNVECFVVQIPINISHQDFFTFMKNKFKEY